MLVAVSPRFDVCVIGSANLDLVATTDRLPGPGETVLGSTYAEHAGGKGLNQAVAAARAGAVTAFAAAVGDDDAARQLLQVMGDDGIDVTSVVRLDGVPTGRALIGVSAEAENFIIVVAGANGLLEPTQVVEAAGSARVVLAQLEVPIETVHAALAAGRAAGAVTVLNPAPAPAGGLPASLLELCDVVIPNEHEVELLGGLDALFELGAKAVVVTLGARGAKLCTPDGAVSFVRAFTVDAIDTTAAGDAFCGGFAAAIAGGAAMVEALRFAAATAALATTRAGAVPSLPSRVQIDALLAGDEITG
ncbi:MAG: rbsK [Ilumatobacteraceae bacterium]|nr:rbsK [Ilumatobacteraceae bacterium]